MLRRLARDNNGSVAIEFALLGPVFLALMLGVLQFGLGMQNYNALRSISAETARYSAVNLQKKLTLDDAAIQNYAISTATLPPYALQSTRFTATVTTATTQRVTGATEKTMTLKYRVPSILGFIGISEIPLTYTRPIFLIKNT